MFDICVHKLFGLISDLTMNTDHVLKNIYSAVRLRISVIK